MRPLRPATSTGSADGGTATASEPLVDAARHLTPARIREARRYAVQFVYQLELNQQMFFQEHTLDLFCRQFGIAADERDFVRAVALGVTQGAQILDELISHHSKNWKLSRIAKVDLAILRVCAFELKTRMDTPVDIIIADGIEIAKQYGATGSSAFVNGVLDGIARALRPR